MELEVRIAQHAHLWSIEPFDLRLFADAKRRDEIAHFEPYEGHGKAEDRYDYAIDELHNELREVTVQQTAHAIGAVKLHHLIANDAVPARAVFAGREDPDRQDTPQAVRSMDRDGACRIIDTHALKEKYAKDNQNNRYRADDRCHH